MKSRTYIATEGATVRVLYDNNGAINGIQALGLTEVPDTEDAA
jgi:hypothetical protein